MHTASVPLAVHLVGLALLVLLATALLIGDASVRLANTSSDDGLVAYAYLVKYPERFGVDAALLNQAPAALTSMMHWLPAALFKYAGVNPEATHTVFVYAQAVLLAVAVFLLARTLIGRYDVAWLTALFVIGARPHWWNFAVYGDLDWMAYPGNFALPPLVLSVVFALKGRAVPSLALALAGGLIHPLLGLFNAAVIGILWLQRKNQETSARWLLAMGGLAGVTAAFLAPPVLLSLRTPQLPSSELLPTILSNGHIVPWANPACSYCLGAFVASLVAVTGFIGLAWYALRLPGVIRGARALLIASLAVAIGGLLAHLAAYAAGSAGGLKLVMHRASLLMILYAMPLVVAWVWTSFQQRGLASALVASRFLVAPSVGLVLATMLTLTPGGPSEDLRGFRRRAPGALRVLGFGLFWLIVVMEVPRLAWMAQRVLGAAWGSGEIVAPLLAVDLRLVDLWVWSVAAILFLWYFATQSGRLRRYAAALVGPGPISGSRAALLIMVLALTAGTLWVNRSRGRTAVGGEAGAFHEVQSWARESTAPADAFIVASTSIYAGWRNYTHRPSVAPYAVGGVYFYPLTAMEYNRRLARFYSEMLGVDYNVVSRRLIDEREFWEFYSKLDEEGLRRFAATFGGKYVVRRSIWPALNLPVAFRNADYTVHEIPVP